MNYSTKKILNLFGWFAIVSIVLTPFIYMGVLTGASAAIISSLMIVAFVVWWKKLKPWLQGDSGEMDVWDELNKLPQEFYCIDSVVLGNRGNVDNIVVGPTGIWVLEVKSFRYFMPQYLRKVLRQAWAEAYNVRDVLKEKLNKEFHIQPVVVYSNRKAEVNFGKEKVEGVYVVRIRWLNDLIRNDVSQKLDSQTIQQIRETLKPFTE